MADDATIDLTTGDQVALPGGVTGLLRQAFAVEPSPEVAELHLARLQVVASRLQRTATAAALR